MTINDTFKPGFRDGAEPKEAAEPVKPADDDGGFVEVDLSEQKDESKIKTIVVEEHTAAVVDEKNIEKKLYDPLKDVHNYKRPPVDLLDEYSSSSRVTDEEITFNKKKIEETLANFGIPIREMKATIGPTVTLYEIVQEQGVKISRIQGLENDIAQSLKALGIRIIAPIPGRGTIGIEVPNRDKEIVSMRSAILSKRFQQFNAELPIVIGRTIQNENYVFDLAKMPHLLVAGATGQGKSVGLNSHNHLAALPKAPGAVEVRAYRPEDGGVLALCQTRKTFPCEDGLRGRRHRYGPEKGRIHLQLTLSGDGRTS